MIPGPNAGWAEAVFGEPDLERLWDAVADGLPPRRPPTPSTRGAGTSSAWARGPRPWRSGASTPLRYRGPGTDLEIGLLPAAHWATAALALAGGVPCVVNLPTEEVYTTPDARRTEGHVRTTMPFNLGGAIVRGLELTFRGGRCVEVRAEEGAELVRAEMAVDANALPPRRGRARRRRLARRADGPAVHGDAARRERLVPHRVGLRRARRSSTAPPGSTTRGATRPASTARTCTPTS